MFLQRQGWTQHRIWFSISVSGKTQLDQIYIAFANTVSGEQFEEVYETRNRDRSSWVKGITMPQIHKRSLRRNNKKVCGTVCGRQATPSFNNAEIYAQSSWPVRNSWRRGILDMATSTEEKSANNLGVVVLTSCPLETHLSSGNHGARVGQKPSNLQSPYPH